MSMDEIIAALLKTHRADLLNIRRYIAWMKIRRKVNNHFYLSAHWVGSGKKHHWIQ